MEHSGCIGWRNVIAYAVTLAAACGPHNAPGQSPPNLRAPAATDDTHSILATAEQVHRLTRSDAARAHPAVIRGVVTCALPDSEAVVMQDSTRGIYVDRLSPALGGLPGVGDRIEVEGVTDPGEFAPLIHARRISRLGAGELPQPIRPAWDQLINGSLDTQFVEIQGVVTAVRATGVTLLTHGGRIQAELLATNTTPNPTSWTEYENALIRLRGCLFASWDGTTHQVRVGEIRMFSPAVMVDEPAPVDLFSTLPKRVPDLLLFDPEASALQRVKVSGQIVHERDGEYYLMDGVNGLRFVLRQPARLAVGDLVDVVGYPSLAGPSPVLRETVVRKLGNRAVPEAKPLRHDNLFRAEHDATRVRVEAVLLSLSADQQALELQAGLQRFAARLNPRSAPTKPLPVGSRLQLTGVYAGHGASRTTGGEIGSFELLLNSPGDIRLLARPPFWTLPRMLVLVGALVGVLAVALFWIRLLHHRVQTRTAQLQMEMREREQAEHQRMLEQERARIARDLHDDLGSSLTEISLLATAGPGLELPVAEKSERRGMIPRKSRPIIHALDEIVWAVDPQRDTLASVARYLASYTEEYLGGLNVTCRVQIPNSFPGQVMSGEVRHDLFLAVKEILTNAVRHGGATEVGFGLRVLPDRLQISLRDNGRGFDLSRRSNGHGLPNLCRRLERLGGRCELSSAPGAGTTVSLHLPLPIRNAPL